MSSEAGTPGDGENVTITSGHVTTKTYKPIGPPEAGMERKKKYKFIEPPGIFSWAFSFFKKSFACGVVYLMGYFEVSVGWLVAPIILMVVRDQWKQHHEAQRALAAASTKGDEREIVLARLGDNLPSWVVFPDVERAEWLNSMIKQLWPRINRYTYDFVVGSIEPGLRESLAVNYKMGSFRFEKILLGDTPLRVRGVKVYDSIKTDRNEIIMDLDIMYAGDCDFRFSVAKINAGIKDLHLSGTLRLIMKPLIDQMPLIGGVQYFFLNPPNLDFNLIGVADVLDMPGLSDLIRRVVMEQISSMCVLPNKMFIQLAENVTPQETLHSEPQGVLRICAVEARDLLKKDIGVLGMGKSDPYVILQVGAQERRSKIINNTVNPKWDYHCEMLVEELGQRLNIELYDHDDAPRADEFLGRTSVDLKVVSRETAMDLWLELQDVKKGYLHLKLTWLGFSNEKSELKYALTEAQAHGLSSSMLTVKLDSAINLPIPAKRTGGRMARNPQVREYSKPDAYAILSVGKIQQASRVLEKTVDPVFEETFQFLVNNPQTDTLVIKFMDKKSNSELATLPIQLDSVYNRPAMRIPKQNFAMNTKSDSKVKMSLELKVLKVGGEITKENLSMEPDADDYSLKSADKVPSTTVSATDNAGDAGGDNVSISSAPVSEFSERMERSEVSKSLTSNRRPNGDLDKDDGDETKPLQFYRSHEEEMKVRLTIRYSQNNQQLIVVLHSLSNLPIEGEELPDPYVKLYLLPERDKKHKTDVRKDQCNPVYDQRFEFPAIDLRGKKLEVTVCDKKFLRSSAIIGEALIDLEDFQSGSAVTDWYPLFAQ